MSLRPRAKAAWPLPDAGIGRVSKGTLGHRSAELPRSYRASRRLSLRPLMPEGLYTHCRGFAHWRAAWGQCPGQHLAENSFEDIREVICQEKHDQNISAEDVMRFLPKGLCLHPDKPVGCRADTAKSFLAPKWSFPMFAGIILLEVARTSRAQHGTTTAFDPGSP